MSKSLRYPPYSVKLQQVSGPVSIYYKITVKASEGNRAHVSVFCIETLSGSKYSNLRDIKGNNICKYHSGCSLEGIITLEHCPVDVGLLIQTPYVFSGDIDDDPSADLAVIHELTCIYS